MGLCSGRKKGNAPRTGQEAQGQEEEKEEEGEEEVRACRERCVRSAFAYVEIRKKQIRKKKQNVPQEEEAQEEEGQEGALRRRQAEEGPAQVQVQDCPRLSPTCDFQSRCADCSVARTADSEFL